MQAAVGFLFMLVLMLLRMPVAFAMLLVGGIGFAVVNDWMPALNLAARVTIESVRDYGLSVVPLYLLMGNFMVRAKLSEELYASAYAWIGHRRGGLAMATVLSCAGFGAVCGSSLATTAIMAKVALPPMRRFGYADSLAAGAIAAGGTLGIMIPPSIIMVLYGIITNTDIGKLFVAGILPGILGAVLYNLAISWTTRRRPELGPPGEVTPWPMRWRSLLKVSPVLGLFVLVIGGIYTGLFTPTEAAGIGAFGAYVLAALRVRLGVKEIYEILIETAQATAAIFVVLIGALVFSTFLDQTGAPRALGQWIADLGLPPIVFICAVVLVLIALGSILDSISMILLTVPLFFPVAMAFGYDPVWFGILIVVLTEISLITPPVGMNIFVLASVADRLSVGTIYRGIYPFCVADFVRVAILVAVPSVSLLLPSMMK